MPEAFGSRTPEGEARGHRRIDGVPAHFEDLDPDPRSLGLRGGHHTVRSRGTAAVEVQRRLGRHHRGIEGEKCSQNRQYRDLMQSSHL